MMGRQKVVRKFPPEQNKKERDRKWGEKQILKKWIKKIQYLNYRNFPKKKKRKNLRDKNIIKEIIQDSFPGLKQVSF